MQDEIRTLPQKLLMGRRALVTGAGRGIGREIARQMALEGADVIINARKEPELLTLREEITAMGQKCQIVLGDICTPETAEKFAAAAEEWGGLDILVNNAGILDRDGTLQTTPETLTISFRSTSSRSSASPRSYCRLCARAKAASSISHLPLPVRLIPTRTRPMARPRLVSRH